MSTVPANIMRGFNRHAPRATTDITPKMFVELLRQICGLNGIGEGERLLQTFRDYGRQLLLDGVPVTNMNQFCAFMQAVLDLMQECPKQHAEAIDTGFTLDTHGTPRTSASSRTG